jgi:hypothetical protein
LSSGFSPPRDPASPAVLAGGPTSLIFAPAPGALANLRTTAAVYLALLKIVEQFQFADHPAVRKRRFPVH